jgi:hypothetical protein
MSMITSTAGTQLVQHGRCMLSVSRLWRTSRSQSSFRAPQRYVSTGSQPRDNLPDVQRLAELSQIEVTPEEVRKHEGPFRCARMLTNFTASTPPRCIQTAGRGVGPEDSGNCGLVSFVCSPDIHAREEHVLRKP